MIGLHAEIGTFSFLKEWFTPPVLCYRFRLSLGLGSSDLAAQLATFAMIMFSLLQIDLSLLPLSLP